MVKNYRGKRALGFLVFLAFFAAAAAIVMLLWNALIPAIIGWAAIGYWQAAGLLLLCRLLFCGLGKMGFAGPMMGYGMAHKHMGRMDEVREKMKGMSHDERREFIRRRMEEFREGCCNTAPETETAE